MEDYLKAKKDFKRDFIIFLVLSGIMTVAVTLITGNLFFSIYNETKIFIEKIYAIALEMFVVLFGGVMLASMFSGWILSFRFVWRKIGGLSILLAIIVYAIGAAYGWLITAIYFIIGFFRIRKLGKVLGVIVEKQKH